MNEWLKSPSWPQGKRFAFTIFDDPDGQTFAVTQAVYGFLSDLGLRTTIAVWPSEPRREPNSGGETCANPRYLKYLRQKQKDGFEIAWHNATPHTSNRQETREGLDHFRDYFGHNPVSMANHYNGEAIYWGPDRLSGMRRKIYSLITRRKTVAQHFGHVEGHPCFWGDFCRENILYCRNFTFSDINTLEACPWMPYHDPDRPWVNRWFASTDGAHRPDFCRAIDEAKQDRLEAQGGACILYTHFGHGFVDQKGILNPDFVRLLRRVSRKNGWFVPVRVILDHLAAKRGIFSMNERARTALERRWLAEKIFRGTS
jgi:hypothetical protein